MHNDSFQIVWAPANMTPSAQAFTSAGVQVRESLFDALCTAQDGGAPDRQPFISFQNLLLTPENVRTLHRKALQDKETARSASLGGGG